MIKPFKVNLLLLIPSLLGLLSVVMGAMADHAFTMLTEQQRHSLDTAIRYNMIYAIFAIGLALYGQAQPARSVRIAAWTFIAGIILFSGGIYMSILLDIAALTYATPFGGVAFMVGWGWLAICGIGRTVK